MTLFRSCLAWIVLASISIGGVEAQYTLKTAKSPPPKEMKETIRSLMAEESLQLVGADGKMLLEVWLRKEIPATATRAHVKKGLTYRELPETALLGIVRVSQPWADYRKQMVNPGVYSLRLGIQPMDGDHMGTAPYNEFCLLVPAADEKEPGEMQPKELNELSTKASSTGHPAIMLLYPNSKPTDAPSLTDKGDNTWLLNSKITVRVGEQVVPLGISLTVIGVSPAA